LGSSGGLADPTLFDVVVDVDIRMSDERFLQAIKLALKLLKIVQASE